MKQTICEQTMNKFLELDKNENFGIRISLHLLKCKKCRTLVRICSVAQRSSARPLHIPVSTNDNIESIIKKANPSIELLKDSHVKPVTMKRWVLSGLSLLICFLTFAIFVNFTTPKELEITVYLVFSIIFCIYIAFFIGSNLDFFVKLIDKYNKN